MTSWTTPRTWVVGEVVTAAEMNQNVRDNTRTLAAAAIMGMPFLQVGADYSAFTGSSGTTYAAGQVGLGGSSWSTWPGDASGENGTQQIRLTSFLNVELWTPSTAASVTATLAASDASAAPSVPGTIATAAISKVPANGTHCFVADSGWVTLDKTKAWLLELVIVTSWTTGKPGTGQFGATSFLRFIP